MKLQPEMLGPSHQTKNQLNLGEKNVPGRRMNRRDFLSMLAGAAAAGGLGYLGLKNYTEQVYAQQNLTLLRQILSQPPTHAAGFGISTDPKLPIDKNISRYGEVIQQVGVGNFFGQFMVLSDFETPEKQQAVLANWRQVTQLAPDSILQIALGSSTTNMNQHLLVSPNLPWLEEQLQHVAEAIKQFNRPIEIRFLYEMNTLGFIYSRKQYQISDQDQVTGFFRAAAAFDQILKKMGIRDQVKIVFNPTANQPFENFGGNQPGLAVFDKIALDIYDYCRVLGYFVGDQLMPPGKYSPAQLMTGSVATFLAIAPEKPHTIGEIGTFSGDVGWLENLLFNLAARDITEIVPFDVDKSSPTPFLNTGNWDAFPEVDFRLTPDMILLYRSFFQLLELTQQPQSVPRDQQLLQVANWLHIPLMKWHLAA